MRHDEWTRTHVAAVADPAGDERRVFQLGDLVLEHVNREFAMLRRQLRRRYPLHERFGPNAVLDEIGHRDHEHVVFLGKPGQFRHARHRAVFVHDFADDAGRVQPRNPREIDRSLSLTSADQHAARA